MELEDGLDKESASPVNSGDINTGVTKEKLEDYVYWLLRDELNKKSLSPIDSGDINTAETKEPPPIKNKQWMRKTIISLCTAVLIVAALKMFGFLPAFDRLFFPDTNKKVTKNFDKASIPKGSAPLPAPPVAKPVVVPALVATPAPVSAPVPKAAPVPVPAPVQQAMQKIKVIGNSDSKRYHLPGMKYYKEVKAYHRVEFDSEDEAISAGYKKASK